MYPQEVIEEVRMGNDIVALISSYTQLKQRGGTYFGLCPFHKERTPSFTVSPDKQLFHCFGCGTAGNAYSFVMKIENYGFADAVKFLADRIHYTLPEKDLSPEYLRRLKQKEEIYSLNKTAARFYHERLRTPEGGKGASYLKTRGIHTRTAIRFGLGFSPGRPDALYKHVAKLGVNEEILRLSGLFNEDRSGRLYDRFSGRIMFPIFDVTGRITGFGGRVLDGDGMKYLNSPETPVFEKSRNLYGINFARQSKQKTFILVEGYMDVLALNQAGFISAVAALGTAFNQEHAKLLKKYCEGVILLFDGDQAGRMAALKAIPVLEQAGLKVSVLTLEGAKDPDEYITKFGSAAFADKLNDAASSVMFRLSDIKNRHDLNKTEGRVAFTTEAAGVLAELDNLIERDAYIRDISSAADLSRDAISAEINKLSDRREAAVRLKAVAPPPYGEYVKPDDRGYTEAVKTIIYIAASSQRLCSLIEEHLDAHELENPTYTKLLRLVYQTHRNNGHIYGAELVSRFEDLGEQKDVSDVFTSINIEMNDVKAVEKTVNELVKKIKFYHIDMALRRTEDANEQQKYLEMKRNTSNLYIKVTDG